MSDVPPKNIPLAVLQSGFHHTLLDHVTDGVYFVDKNCRISYWNKGAERISGYSSERVLGAWCGDNLLRHVTSAGVCLCEKGCPLALTLKDGVVRESNIFLHHRDGCRVPVHISIMPVRDDKGEIIGAVETFSDNSAHMTSLEQIRELEELAFLDPLTDLANRRHLENQIESKFVELRRHGNEFGLILMDVDHFKAFNDQYGHDVGDKVLRMVGQTLSRNCRVYDTVGRWGGEEFLIVTTHLGRNEIHAMAERLRVLVESSWIVEGNERLALTASFGATMANQPESIHDLMKRVDRFMYRSKLEGRNRVTSSDIPENPTACCTAQSA